MFNVIQSNTQKFRLCESMLQFLEMHYLKDQTASGLTRALEKSFESTEIKIKNKSIGFTSDGALVNRGDKNSVKTNLQADSLWLMFIWCITHHLELAISDALNGIIFNTIDEMILQFYITYIKKCLKKHVNCMNWMKYIKMHLTNKAKHVNQKKHRIRTG